MRWTCSLRLPRRLRPLSNFAPKPSVTAGGVPIAGQRLAVAGSAVAFAAFNVNTNLLIVDCQVSDLYVTFDGTVPSSTNGAQLYAGNSYAWNVATAQNARFIQQSSAGTIQGYEFVSILGATQMPVTDVLKPRNATAGSGVFSSLHVTGTSALDGAVTMGSNLTVIGPDLFLGTPAAGSSMILNVGAGNTSFTGGATFNGSSFVAQTTNPTIIQNAAGAIAFYVDSGKSVGSTYTPTSVGTISTTGLTISGSIATTIYTGVQYQIGASSGSLPVGSMTYNSTNGFVVIGKAGSSFDYYLGNGTGANTLTIPTGTTSVQLFGPLIHASYAVASLPAAAGANQFSTAFVNNATQAAGTSIGSAPIGGGGVVRAVYSTGAAWLLL